MSQGNQIVPHDSQDVAARGQKMAAALVSYSRQLALSNRSRRSLYQIAGISPLLRDRIFSALLKTALVICFLIPFAATVLYFAVLVTPQYESEVRFVVRSAAPLLTRDRFSSSSAEPEQKIVQDTQIIVNYIDSPALVAALGAKQDLHRLFGGTEIDHLSRLEPDISREDLLEYWRSQHDSWINPKSGIVELQVRAFSAADAQNLLIDVLELADQRVNRLNRDIWSNLLYSAKQDLQEASIYLEEKRLAYRDLQNQTGVFDVEQEAERRSQLIEKIDSIIADLRSEREALVTALNDSIPAVRRLDRQIAAREQQSADLKARNAGQSSAQNATLAEHSRLFEEATLELEIAEDRFRAAINELEKVKLVSSLQLVYLDRFSEPTLADDSTHPNVALSILLGLLASLALWGVVSGGLILLRQKLD